MNFDPFLELQSQIAKRTSGCRNHPPFERGCITPLEGDQWESLIQECTPDARWSHERWFALNDLYYLLVHIFGIRMLKTQWHLDRIREMEVLCDDVIDLWSRGTGKSAIKTFGKVIQEILRNSDITIGIFSHTRPIAKDFMKKIKTTFESHTKLRNLFPDVLYDKPESESPCWSIERGLVVKRQSVTRGESTVEAWGLVDGQPTSKHFDILVYDDVQKEQITDYMIDQIEQSFDTSLGLGADKPPRWWMCGVFFRGGSFYENMIERKVGLARIRPAINDDGTSPIWTDDQVRATIKNLKPGTIACEYLMDPTKKGPCEGFLQEWLRYHNGFTPEQLNSGNIYIVVDPGKGKERQGRSGKTSIQVIAFMPDKKRYLIDGIKAAMDLEQRTSWVFSFHRQYNGDSRIMAVGYEQYGLQADVDHIRLEQQREGYMFEIVPLSAHIAKNDRIEMLMPIFKNGEMVIPKFIPKRIVGGVETDFLKDFINDEYSRWPATKIRDALDCMSWITYVKEDGDNKWRCQFPESYDDPSVRRRELDWDETGGEGGSWMTK